MKNAELEPKIALFIDYDNIAIGLKESGGQRFEVTHILERLLEKGRIIYKRAYADWYLFSDAKQALHDAAVEMVDIPMRRHIGKNSADIRLVVDALDLCYTKEHIDTFVIGSGDSDFSPLVSKLKENDKHVIGFGLRGSTSNLLADNCDEFIYYEDLISLPINRPPLPPGLTVRQSDAFTILLDTIAALIRENKDILWGSLVKDTIRRKQPAFSESRFGYSTFSQLLEDAAQFGLIGLIKDPKSGGTPVVTGFGKFIGDEVSTVRLSRPIPGTAVRGPSLQVRAEPARISSIEGEGDKTGDSSILSRHPSLLTNKTKIRSGAAVEGALAKDKIPELTKKSPSTRTIKSRQPVEDESEIDSAKDQVEPKTVDNTRRLKSSASADRDGTGKHDDTDISRRAKSTIRTKKLGSRRRLPPRIKSDAARTAQITAESESIAVSESTLHDSQKEETVPEQTSNTDGFTDSTAISSNNKDQETPSTKEFVKSDVDSDSLMTGERKHSSRPVRKLKRIRRR